MNGNDMPIKQEGVGAPAGVWTTPTSQGMRPRPATIHEGFSYSMSDDYGTLPSWDSSPLPMQQTPSDAMSRPVSVHQQDFYPVTTMENSESVHQRLTPLVLMMMQPGNRSHVKTTLSSMGWTRR